MIFLRPTSRLATATVLAAALAACASAPVPNEKLAVAEAAVARANTTSTSQYAAGELQTATAKLAAAREAVRQQDNVRAGRLADEAAVDAQVAEVRAQAAASGKTAKESQDAARALREELDRKVTR